MSKTIVITGANRGIGLCFAQQYASTGASVYAICRTPSPELEALDLTVISGVDVGQPDCVANIKKALSGLSIDLLINNAGILNNDSLGSMDYDAIRQQIEVNALAPLKITEALIPQLAADAKIAMITSRMGSMADNGSGGYYGYRMSKAALNMASVSLAQDLKPQGIAVGILHPGFVSTEMVGGQGDISPNVAAERLIQRIEELNIENTGTFWHSYGDKLPW